MRGDLFPAGSAWNKDLEHQHEARSGCGVNSWVRQGVRKEYLWALDSVNASETGVDAACWFSSLIFFFRIRYQI